MARQHAAEGDDMTKDEEGGLQSQVLLRPSVAGDAADWCRSRRHDERALGTGQHHETNDSTQQGRNRIGISVSSSAAGSIRQPCCLREVLRTCGACSKFNYE